MSVILKGIDFDEITKGNGYARLIIEEDGTVVDDISDIIIGEAIQIPKGHGRLIDGDELVKHLRKDPLFDLVERYGVSGVIESRPTILDKERE